MTIDALKDNIREAIGEIQLHTNDNVLKNWTHRVGYCTLENLHIGIGMSSILKYIESRQKASHHS